MDYNALMEPVALRLLGPPAQKRGNEWRYGTRGSLAIDIKKGTWFDHEANKGGGVLELIRRRQYGDPRVWLQSVGLTDPSRSHTEPPQVGSQTEIVSQTEPPQVGSQTEPKMVKTYDYRDEADELLFQVVRYEPKGFRQRRPDGRGGYIYNLKDTRRVPYRLPEVVKAVAAGQTIYIPEGEKDVDNLIAIGIAATTNPCGIKKWRDEYSGHLRGADVVVLPDNHAEGREHGEQVASSLRGIAKRIRILDIGKHWAECPNKGDISDWLAAGGTADKIKAIVDTLPEVSAHADKGPSNHHAPAGNPISDTSWRQGTFSAEALQNETFPPLKWVVQNIIPAEGTTLLCSKPKFGKSWLVLDLCLGCTSDRYILNSVKPMQGDVLYLALEDSKRRLQRRITKLLPTFGPKWPARLTIKTEWRRLHEGGLTDIQAWHDETKRAGGKPIMVAVDVLAKVRKPTGNRQLYEADYEALAGLTALANELGICVLVVSHVRKMAADDLMETVSGSFGTTGAVDTILVMANRPSGAVLDIRGRDVESAEFAIQFSKATCRWTVLGSAAEVHVSEQRAKIIAALKDAGEPMTVSALKAATGMSGNAPDALLSRMAKAGDIKRVTKGAYADKDYEPPPPSPGGKPSLRRKRPDGSPTVLTNLTDGCQDKTRSQHVENNGNFSAALQPDAPDRLLPDNEAERHPSKPCQISQDVRTDSQAPITNEEFPRNGPDRQKSGASGWADGPGLPESLTEVICAHCGRPGGNEVAFGDEIGPVWLHRECETPWIERRMGEEGILRA